jgi:hypothetical protein
MDILHENGMRPDLVDVVRRADQKRETTKDTARGSYYCERCKKFTSQSPCYSCGAVPSHVGVLRNQINEKSSESISSPRIDNKPEVGNQCNCGSEHWLSGHDHHPGCAVWETPPKPECPPNEIFREDEL